jgi:hypothetical protein
MTTILETALFWKNIGIATIPIKFRDKKPDLNWHDFKTRLPSYTELQRWFTGNLHNIGLIVGWNNLVVIDFDNLSTYTHWLLWTSKRGGISQFIAERTYQVKTARGIHIYVYLPQADQNRKLPGIDIKARNGYVLIPPSVHPSGINYQPINPNNHIVMAEALSDIIPASLLLSNTEYLPAFFANTVQVPNSDPWASAERVPDPTRALVDQAREKHSLLEFFPQAESTSSNSRWYVDKCPFHDDHNPSFWIDIHRGICGCYAGCTSKPLDVINLYSRLYGITNREAIFYLSKG